MFRGGSAVADFYPDNCFELGKKGYHANYCKEMAGIKDRGNIRYTRGQIAYGAGTDTPVLRSFGATLLANITERTGECAYDHAHRNITTGDLYVLPLQKKDFINKSGLFFVRNDCHKYGNFYGTGLASHLRQKAHALNQTKKTVDRIFTIPDERIIEHAKEEDVCKGYAKAQKIILKNAIPLTLYTKEKLNTAKKLTKRVYIGKTVKE